MKVSVIIPTYNRADLLGEALASALSQPYDDFEIIVVDDGSTDATPSVLARFADPRLRVVRQANQGISGARNAGVAEARGEYIIMLDSDDRWRPNILPRLVQTLEAHPDAVLVYGRAQAIDPQGRPMPQMKGAAEPFPGQTQRSILYGDFVPGITALIRRAALVQAGPFDAAVSGTEDWDMWIRLSHLGRFVFIDATLADFRLHPTQFTQTGGDRLRRLMAARVHVLDKAFAAPGLSPDLVAMRPLAYRNVYVTEVVRWLSVGGWRDAFVALRQALRYGNPVMVLIRVVYLSVFYRLVRRLKWARVVSDTLFAWRRGQRLKTKDWPGDQSSVVSLRSARD